jgi:hypothetical protein
MVRYHLDDVRRYESSVPNTTNTTVKSTKHLPEKGDHTRNQHTT